MSRRTFGTLAGILSMFLVWGLVGHAGEKEKPKFNPIYVPTEEKVIEKMFEMAKLTPKDVVFDLGCGDGRIPAMAVKRGCKGAVGVDLNPDRILDCLETIKRYEVQDYLNKGLLEYRLGDALKVHDLERASVIMLYMLPEFLDHLQPIAKKTLKPGTRIVSHDYRWRVGNWEPEVILEYKGPTRTHTLYLWTVK